MAPYKFHIINAFSDDEEGAEGNPAAVCLVDQFPDEKTMGEAAKRLGAPMTSFIRKTNEKNTFEIRHFSPAEGEENHVCGHATMAAAEFLALEYPELRKGNGITFKLNPKFGISEKNECKVSIKGRNITVALPAVMEMQKIDDPEFYTLLADALNIKESDIDGPAWYAPRIINYVIAFRDEKTLLNMKPDFEKLLSLARSEKFPHEGIMATSKTNIKGYDILTRVFLPITGVNEDVACGSANCSVIPYWTEKRPGAFPPDKTAFCGIFPYPPRLHENIIGGIQYLSFDREKKEIGITGKATYTRPWSLDIAPPETPVTLRKPSPSL